MTRSKSVYDHHVNPNRAKRNWGRVLAALVILIATAVLIFLTLNRYFAVSEVQLPNVVGLSSEEAVAVLAELELEPVLFTEDIANAIINSVTSQSPEAGTVVRKGRSVAVGVNKPEVRINIPSVIDITQLNAQEMLANLGLKLDQIDFAFSDAEEGRVIAQEPVAGTVASDKASVSIVVSRGPELATFRMPEVRGLNIDEAKKRLQGMGLRNIEALAATVSFENPDVVTVQVPAPGNLVTTGSHVVLNFAMSTQTIAQVPQLVGMPLSQVQMQLNAVGLSLGQVTYIQDPVQPAGIVTYAPSGYTLRGVPVEVTLNRANLIEPETNLSIAPDPSVATPSGQIPELSQTDPTQSATGSVSQGPNITPIAETSTNTNVSPIDTLEQINPDSPQQATSSIQESVTSNSDGARQIPFNFDPTNLGVASLQSQAYKFKLVIDDERGERIAVERQVEAGQSVQIIIDVYGETTLQTYINDILFQAWNP